MRRKLLFFLALLLTMTQSAWALSQQDGYYIIGSAQDLKDFAALVNSGSTTANGKLIAPIDLQGSESNQWTPIGTGYSWKSKSAFGITRIYVNET